MRERPDRHRKAWLLAALVLVAASIPGCTAGETSPLPSLLTPPTATSAPRPTASLPTATGGPSPTSVMAGSPATTLLAVGDIGRCDSTHDDDTGALAASMHGVVATLGDTAYEDGTTEELVDCFGGSWGAVKDRISFAVTGNHDVHTDGGAPLQEYMGSAAARDGRTWFSEDLGAWHVVVLDGNCGLAGRRCGSGSQQARWLREDLAASNARCTLALLHQPRFSSGQHGDDRAVGPLWDALHEAGADLVLAGHDHDYERFGPQDPDGRADSARGITEIVAGTGGAELEAFGEAQANSLVRVNDAYGLLELTLLADSWSFRFVDVDGTVRDQGIGACH